jgi:murein DD-endopeptidase MepM/ murein hydrolase activator NlpD
MALTARLSACLALAALSLGLAGGTAAAPPLALGPPATAQALAVEIIGPDQSLIAGTTQVSAPPTATLPQAGFVYPEDGSIVAASSTFATVSASAPDGTAAAATELTNLLLFGGEIAADGVRASVSSAGTIGDLSDSTVTNLVVDGQPVALGPNTSLPLGDWGTLDVLGQSTKPGRTSWRGTVSALVVRLSADHGGLLAGSTIRVGFADAYSRTPAPATTATRAQRTAPPPKSQARKGGALQTARPAGIASRAAGGKHKAKRPGGLPVLTTIPNVTPKLTAGHYVFPVYGPSGYGDTFGAPRGDVSGGWHHGDDIFAPLGAPVLAVADGTVFSVGWNDVGGYRLWLRDRAGNEFYYAHLSAYTTLAVNGRHVKAGEVLAFVGNTGDAEGTPFHLHFEVHPVSMLFLGYDGAVNPTKYLDAWRKLEDIRILPAVPFSTGGAQASSAPVPGAILLQSSDISTANGLDPGSLTRAMNAPATLDVTKPSLSELPSPLPVLDRA